MEEVVEEAARLDDARRHRGDARRIEGDHARMQHLRRRHARQRAVREEAAEADREQQQGLEALDDGEVHHDQAERDHDELADAVRQAAEHLDLVALHKGALAVEVAADPLAVLVVVAVRRLVAALGIVRVLADHVVGRHAVLLRVVAGDEGRRLLLQEARDAHVVLEVDDAVERRPPLGRGGRRLIRGRGREAADRDEQRHKEFLHCSFLSG